MHFLKRFQQPLPSPPDPTPPQFLGGRYHVVEQLGSGGFSQTFLAEDRHLPGHPRCVVKQLKPQKSDPRHLQTARRLFDTEARVLYELGNHPQIPQLLAHFEDNQEFYLVQELIEGEPLTQKLVTGQAWSEQWVVAFLKDLLHVLQFVHDQQVIHRDIKPSNLICRTDGRIVLIDFGAVKQVSSPSNDPTVGHSLTISIGTQGYTPVEQLSGSPRFSSDIYAVGMVGIQALTGIHPKQIDHDLQTGEIDWRKLFKDPAQSDPEVHSQLADILDRMICYHFRERFQTVEEVLQALEELPDALNAAIPSDILLQPESRLRSLEVAIEPGSTPEPDAAVPIMETDSSVPLSEPHAERYSTLFLPHAPVKPLAIDGNEDRTEQYPDLDPSTSPDPSTSSHSSSHSSPHSAPNPASNSAFPLQWGQSNPQFPSKHPTNPTNNVESGSVPNPDDTLASDELPPPSSLNHSGRSTFPQWQPFRLPTGWLKLLGLIGAIGALGLGSIAVVSRFTHSTTRSPAVKLPDLPCSEPASATLPEEPDYEYEDGTVYYGPLENGLPTDGSVTIVFPSGNRYDGNLSDGKRNGCGMLSFASGRKYVGQFESDQFEGLGTWTLENGDRYIGTFQDNHCHGEGVFILANGTAHQGTWQQGEMVNGDLDCNPTQ